MFHKLIGKADSFEADIFYEGQAGKDYIDESWFNKEGINVVYQNYQHPEYREWSLEKLRLEGERHQGRGARTPLGGAAAVRRRFLHSRPHRLLRHRPHLVAPREGQPQAPGERSLSTIDAKTHQVDATWSWRSLLLLPPLSPSRGRTSTPRMGWLYF